MLNFSKTLKNTHKKIDLLFLKTIKIENAGNLDEPEISVPDEADQPPFVVLRRLGDQFDLVRVPLSSRFENGDAELDLVSGHEVCFFRADYVTCFLIF